MINNDILFFDELSDRRKKNSIYNKYYIAMKYLILYSVMQTVMLSNPKPSSFTTQMNSNSIIFMAKILSRVSFSFNLADKSMSLLSAKDHKKSKTINIMKKSNSFLHSNKK